MLFPIGACIQIYLGHDLDLSMSTDFTSHVTFDTPGEIFCRCSIGPSLYLQPFPW